MTAWTLFYLIILVNWSWLQYFASTSVMMVNLILMLSCAGYCLHRISLFIWGLFEVFILIILQKINPWILDIVLLYKYNRYYWKILRLRYPDMSKRHNSILLIKETYFAEVCHFNLYIYLSEKNPTKLLQKFLSFAKYT